MNVVKKYLVKFILSYLRFFAKVALKKEQVIVVGIAGSVGKSSLKNALYAILKEQGKTIALKGNSETGIPLSIFGLTPDDYSPLSWLKIMLKVPFKTGNLKSVKYIVAEMGIDDPNPPKNMDYLLTIIKPDIAINLNVSATHTMQFEKAFKPNEKMTLKKLIDAIAFEDTKIVTKSNCTTGIYNADNEFITKYINVFRKTNPDIKLLTFGQDKSNSISLKHYTVGPRRTTFTFLLNENKPYELNLNLRGRVLPKAYSDTFAAAVLAARSLKIPLKEIQEGVEKNFSLPKGRSGYFEGIKDSIIIDSTYNASKESMLTFLDLLKDLKRKLKRPAVFVFGDMRELGVASQEEHEEVANHAKKIADYICCVGPQTKEFALPILKEGDRAGKVDWFKNSTQLGLHLKENIQPEAIILFKGSQNEIFLEEAVKFILKNPQDEKKLCRQTAFWKNVKSSYFNSN